MIPRNCAYCRIPMMEMGVKDAFDYDAHARSLGYDDVMSMPMFLIPDPRKVGKVHMFRCNNCGFRAEFEE